MSQLRVFVRFRPVFHNSNEEPEQACIRTSSNNTLEMINLRNTQETLQFEFQQVFNEDSSQDEVFGTVVQPILSRYTDDLHNVSIFAYGPTGSGKTHTVLGSDEQPGFIPRAMRYLFACSRNKFLPSEVLAEFSMSYLEIYQEKVFDLLAASKKLDNIRQDGKGNIFVPGLQDVSIKSFADFENLFVPASKSRRVAKTKINERSSRSHTLLIVKLTTQECKKPFRRRIAKLSLIDLAGSEDNRQTGNVGARLKESSAINTSLHVLGKVVHALSHNAERIPYRDSKLTRLLQDSLGGSAHTCMVVNVSPEMSSIFETHRAITFAMKSKCILNKPFTHELAAGKMPEIEATRTDNKENKPEPKVIFSPSMRKEAKKRNLQIDAFDNQGNLIHGPKTTTNATPCKSEIPQHSIINKCRTATSLFKSLQQTPRSLDTHSTETPVSQVNLVESAAKKVRETEGEIFTITRNNEGYQLQFTFDT